MISIIVAGVIVFLDKITKGSVSAELSIGETIPIIKNIFHITLIHNNKSAFGIFNNQICIAVAAGAALFITYLIFTMDYTAYKNPLIVKISLGMIAGGAIGNLWDRLMLGYVVDFIDFRVWPVFNIADIAVTVGIIILIWQFFTKSFTSI